MCYLGARREADTMDPETLIHLVSIAQEQADSPEEAEAIVRQAIEDAQSDAQPAPTR